MRKLKVNDFFFGCGGLGLAFQEAEKGGNIWTG